MKTINMNGQVIISGYIKRICHREDMTLKEQTQYVINMPHGIVNTQEGIKSADNQIKIVTRCPPGYFPT